MGHAHNEKQFFSINSKSRSSAFRNILLHQNVISFGRLLTLSSFCVMFFAKKGHFQLRDHQQIAFVMLSRFCLLSKTPLTSPVPLSYNAMENTGPNGSWMEYQPKLNQKYIPFLSCISNFEGTSYKSL